MKRFLLSSISAILLSACAQLPSQNIAAAPSTSDTQQLGKLNLFSDHRTGGLPSAWEPLIIHKTKKRTEYNLVTDDGKTVMHARAVAASSGLMQKVDIDPFSRPWLNWGWKVNSLIHGADNGDHNAEDSPARIILGFNGDKDTLPFTDQILFETARVMTGHDFPYATLMYVWENKAPIGTVIPSARSSRIKMMVAASGLDGVGEWKNFVRNVVDDYEKAFGEKPGKLIGVGILSDTDNTGETVEAWYGDIHFRQKLN